MIKSALQYIIGLGEPTIKEIDGVTYSDRKLYEVEPVEDRIFYPQALELTTLSSFIDYIKANYEKVDGFGMFEGSFVVKKPYIHIETYNTIKLYGSLDEQGQRPLFAYCKSITPSFRFDYPMDKEQFIIGLQSLFCDGGHKADLLRIVGTIKQKDIKTSNDDGMTQNVKTTRGIVSGTGENIPNPVMLAPFRTFVEVKQPMSEFIVRIKEHGDDISIGLYEADGGVWKLEAIQNIKEYLEAALDGLDIDIFA